MSDETRPPVTPGSIDSPDDPIARLVRLAGARPPVPEERKARVRDIVHARWRETVRVDRRRRVILIAAPVAAALAVAAGAGVWLRGRILVPPAPAATLVRIEGRVLLGDGRVAEAAGLLAPGAGLATGPDARAALRLSGGPSVRLDAGTELRLISSRLLELERGAVYVDTGGPSPGEAAAVEIQTRLGRVRDVGTQFEVRLTDDALQVSVREGIAALVSDGGRYAAPAGTRVRLGRRGAVETGAVAPGGADWDWVLAVAPPFDLEGRSLRDYLDWLSRETGWKVGYADPSIPASAATVILHGSTSGLRPDETPAVVLPTCGLRHRLDGDRLVIERPAGEGRSG